MSRLMNLDDKLAEIAESVLTELEQIEERKEELRTGLAALQDNEKRLRKILQAADRSEPLGQAKPARRRAAPSSFVHTVTEDHLESVIGYLHEQSGPVTGEAIRRDLGFSPSQIRQAIEILRKRDILLFAGQLGKLPNGKKSIAKTYVLAPEHIHG